MKLSVHVKTYMLILPISAMTLFVSLPEGATAQVAITEVIRAGVKKVIKAMDLKIQRLQNKTIWLQNAQKALENQLSRLKLAEIAEWTERQRELYGNYYRELWEIKSSIAYYQRIRELTEKQTAIVEQYQRAWQLFKTDDHFSAEELQRMEEVYAGILKASVTHLDELLVVVTSFKTQMSDAARLELIAKAMDGMDRVLTDLKAFNRENSLLSIQRARSQEETRKLKALYGIDE